MIRFLMRKLLYGFLILMGINLLTFVLFFKLNTPDDMARMQLGGKRITAPAIELSEAMTELFFTMKSRRARNRSPTHCFLIQRFT